MGCFTSVARYDEQSPIARRRAHGVSGLGMIFLAACVAFGAPCPTTAQSTGGSFGGGSFSPRPSGGGGSGGYGGGGGSYGGGSYGASPSRRNTYGSSGTYGGGYQGTHSSSGGGGSALCCVFFLFLIIAGVVLLGFFRSGDRGRGTGGVVGGIDVSGLMLAVDWRARRQLQEQLAQLARDGDTSSQTGLIRLARQTALALRRADLSWLYASALNALPAPPQQAEAVFRKAAADARAKFRYELIRNADGSSRVGESRGVQASREEGEGVVVITLLVAAHRELIDVHDVSDANQVKLLLEQIIALEEHNLAAIEVIWSPAAEDDRMSTAELEVLYPELRQIRDGTLAGRVFCDYCAAPYARELGSCPHCGAPMKS